ncbi:MAG: CBS domain-containing protein [Proteobacteria bacterium]|nr:CBS domain-containing protein [Pseudomonadota bacterium]
MPIEDLLIDKNKTLHTIGPDETVKAAVTILAANDIGALPVCDAGGKMVGILSERDIVRTLNQPNADIGTMKISEIMKTNVISAGPDDKIRDIVAIMKEKRIRHVPIIKDGELVAMYSVRDLFTYLLEATQAQRDTMTLAYELVR